MDHPTAGRDRLLYMDYPSVWRQVTLHGLSYRLETKCSTWIILQTHSTWIILHYSLETGCSTWAILQLETGCSTWTILQVRDRLPFMDNPAYKNQAALHDRSYRLETYCFLWRILQLETGFSSCTILMGGPPPPPPRENFLDPHMILQPVHRLFYMDHPTNKRQSA